MTAGVATMDLLTVSEIDRINGLGEKLRREFRNIFEEVRIKALVTGTGSLAQVHFTELEKVKDWRGAASGRVDMRTILHLLLVIKGIFIAPWLGMLSISTAMGEKEIDEAKNALKDCLLEMRPYVEKAAPELMYG